MFVISASPLKKGFGLEELSYFSSEDLEVGSVISVPLRKGSIKALVLQSKRAEDMKAEIKASTFSLKKIEGIEGSKFLPKAWMKAVEKTSEYFASPLGSVVASLVPAVAINNTPILEKDNESLNGGDYLGPALFQGNTTERWAHYKSVIREQFAKKKSVFLCLSENEEIERAENFFTKGIEKHTYIFRPNMGKDKFLERYKAVANSEHPVLVIGSSQWLFLPIQNLGTLIGERVEDGSWMTFSRPFLDLRKFLEFFSGENGLNLLFGDSVLSAERLKDLKERDSYAFKSINFRVATVPSLVVDMRRDPREGARSQILSEEILEIVRESREKGKNTFIFSSRKGLSSVTVCRDCGTEVLCKNCASPVVLYKGTKGNVFRCHQCGEARSAEEVCINCSSWRLLPLGLGVERIKEELEKVLPEVRVFELNKEVTPTPSKARKVVEKFYGSPGSVLIGTEMALGFLYEPVDFSVIASIDSLFVVPDYHIREKIFRLILGVKLLALDKFLIQIRNAERETIDMALSGNILEFYNREIKEREELGYPPFSIFIKITSRGPRQNVTEEMSRVAYIFGKFQPTVFPSVSEKKGAQYAENAVIKIGRDAWPEEELVETLKALPPVFEVKVSPDNLL